MSIGGETKMIEYNPIAESNNFIILEKERLVKHIISEYRFVQGVGVDAG